MRRLPVFQPSHMTNGVAKNAASVYEDTIMAMSYLPVGLPIELRN